jgi:hypothetical protein
MVCVGRVKVRDQHAGIQNDHAGHSSRRRSR